MDKYYKYLLKVMPKFILALVILVRIKKCYPYVLQECTTKEEMDELMEKLI